VVYLLQIFRLKRCTFPKQYHTYLHAHPIFYFITILVADEHKPSISYCGIFFRVLLGTVTFTTTDQSIQCAVFYVTLKNV